MILEQNFFLQWKFYLFFSEKIFTFVENKLTLKTINFMHKGIFREITTSNRVDESGNPIYETKQKE